MQRSTLRQAREGASMYTRTRVHLSTRLTGVVLVRLPYDACSMLKRSLVFRVGGHATHAGNNPRSPVPERGPRPTNMHHCGTLPAGEQGHRLNNTAEGCHQRQLRRAPHSAFQPVDSIHRGEVTLFSFELLTSIMSGRACCPSVMTSVAAILPVKFVH